MPDPITWYAMGKQVADDTSIDEEIDAKILIHNLDTSAHGQSNEAIYNHRIAELLDHIDGSVGLRHLVNDNYITFHDFASLDGFSTTGTVVPGLFGGLCTTDAINGSWAGVLAQGVGGSPSVYPAYDPFFHLGAKFGQTSNQLAYLMVGGIPGDGEGDCFGFKISNSLLYALWSKGGSEYTEQITGITLSDLNNYRAYIISAESKIVFYVNGVLKYTAITNFPTDWTGIYAKFYLRTDADVAKTLLLVDWYFEMARA